MTKMTEMAKMTKMTMMKITIWNGVLHEMDQSEQEWRVGSSHLKLFLEHFKYLKWFEWF